MGRAPVAGADHAVTKVARIAARAHVDELGREVGVARAGGSPEAHLDGAGDLQVGLEGGGGVDEDVGPGLNRALVEGPGRKPRGGAAQAAATGGYGVAGVVDEGVDGLIAGGGWVQGAVAVERVGGAAAVQVPGGDLRPRQRPRLFIAPDIGAHHEEPQRRPIERAVIHPLEQRIEPVELLQIEQERAVGGGEAEVDFAGEAGGRPVHPRPHQHTLARVAGGACRGVVVQGVGGKDVVPAADVEHREAEALGRNADPRPVRIAAQGVGE